MIPENVLSTEPIGDFFLTSGRSNPLIDYEWGGVDLRNVTKGMSAYQWSSSYVGNKIILSNEVVAHAVLTVANVTSISFAFDLNMNPSIAYVANGQAYLYWFDSTQNTNVTTPYGALKSPQVALDERRESQSANADVILAYIKNGKLCIRNQRERYTVERELGAFDDLFQIGMQRNYRFGFMAIKIVKLY